MTTAIYPGTFDPLTNGHVDIVKRAAALFDHIIVAVADSADKNPQLSLQDRVEICKETFSTIHTVLVDHFSGLLIDFAKTKNTNIILRGLRGTADLDFEFQLSTMNQMMFPECETLFIKASDTTSSISSTIVREIAAMGGDISCFVPSAVLKKLT